MNDLNEYIEVCISTPNQECDALCNYIIENICNGLILEEEEDAQFTNIKFYLAESFKTDEKAGLNNYINSLFEMKRELDGNITVTEKKVKNVEWEDAYKKSVTPVIVTGDVGVRPPWEDKSAGIKYDIIIEPKMAFGTGKHETTRSCLKVIREMFEPGMSFLDVGCGSGILSILAAKMGSRFIKAVDYDILSVDNCRENFKVNDVTTKSEIALGSIEQCENDSPYDFVCANIIRETILMMLPQLKAATKEGGILVLSGLLDTDLNEIESELNNLDMPHYKIHDDNEWRTIVIYR